MSNETAAPPPTPGPLGDAAGATGAVPAAAMRVSDTERNSALEALGEHLAAGRITLDEYGDRSAKVTVAKTAGDLSALFDDLPAPHPVLPSTQGVAAPFPTAAAPAVPAASAAATPVPPARNPGADNRSTAQKVVGAAAAVSVFVALALFFLTGLWYWFLIIPAISAIAGSIWGPDWKEQGGRGQLRRGRRDRRRELGR